MKDHIVVLLCCWCCCDRMLVWIGGVDIGEESWLRKYAPFWAKRRHRVCLTELMFFFSTYSNQDWLKSSLQNKNKNKNAIDSAIARADKTYSSVLLLLIRLCHRPVFVVREWCSAAAYVQIRLYTALFENYPMRTSTASVHEQDFPPTLSSSSYGCSTLPIDGIQQQLG